MVVKDDWREWFQQKQKIRKRSMCAKPATRTMAISLVQTTRCTPSVIWLNPIPGTPAPSQVRSQFTVSLLTMSPQHGHCNGWRLLEGAEGCTDPYEILFSYLPEPPKVVMYDNACNLSEWVVYSLMNYSLMKYTILILVSLVPLSYSLLIQLLERVSIEKLDFSLKQLSHQIPSTSSIIHVLLALTITTLMLPTKSALTGLFPNKWIASSEKSANVAQDCHYHIFVS